MTNPSEELQKYIKAQEYMNQHREATLRTGGKIWFAGGPPPWNEIHEQEPKAEGMSPIVDIFTSIRETIPKTGRIESTILHEEGVAIWGIRERHGLKRRVRYVHTTELNLGAKAILNSPDHGLIVTGKLVSVHQETETPQEAAISQLSETPIHLGGVAVANG